MTDLEEQLLVVWRRWPLDSQRDRRLNEYKTSDCRRFGRCRW